jgi:hypothetical protein
MPVNPNVVMATPMAGHPAPIVSARPIPRPIRVIGSIADFDVDTDRIRGRSEPAHANYR